MSENVVSKGSYNPIWLIAIAGTIVLLAGAAQFAQNNEQIVNAGTPEFVIQPKVGVVDSSTQDLRAAATQALGAESYVLKVGQSFVMDLRDSKVPNPPAKYYYDNDGNGEPELLFTKGDWAVFTMFKTDPLYSVCQPTVGGEICNAKILGIDSAGNKAEFVLRSTTLY